MFSVGCNSCIKLWRSKWNPERVSNIQPFMYNYNWKGINYPTKIDGLKTYEKNIPTIALCILKKYI